MKRNLVAQIDGTFYANLHYGLIKMAKKQGLSAKLEGAVENLLEEFDLVYNFHFLLRPMMRQIIGKTSPAFDFDLVQERNRLIRPVGGSLNPNVYIIAGDILQLSEVGEGQYGPDEEPSYDIMLDCGVPIDLRQSKLSGMAPGIQIRDMKEDSWIAAIGNLIAWPSDSQYQHCVRCKITGTSIFDLDPSSKTFGTVIPWSFSQKAPADADVMPIPVTFLSLQVLSE